LFIGSPVELCNWRQQLFCSTGWQNVEGDTTQVLDFYKRL